MTLFPGLEVLSHLLPGEKAFMCDLLFFFFLRERQNKTNTTPAF